MTKTEEKRRKALIDELGAIETTLAGMKPKIERAKGIKAEIQTWLSLMPAEQAFLLEGKAYSAQCSARQYERAITDMKRLAELVGQEAFYANCSFALGKVDELVEASSRASILTVDRTGARTIKTLLKG
jgi:hypothetical protein